MFFSDPNNDRSSDDGLEYLADPLTARSAAVSASFECVRGLTACAHVFISESLARAVLWQPAFAPPIPPQRHQRARETLTRAAHGSTAGAPKRCAAPCLSSSANNSTPHGAMKEDPQSTPEAHIKSKNQPFQLAHRRSTSQDTPLDHGTARRRDSSSRRDDAETLLLEERFSLGSKATRGSSRAPSMALLRRARHVYAWRTHRWKRCGDS